MQFKLEHSHYDIFDTNTYGTYIATIKVMKTWNGQVQLISWTGVKLNSMDKFIIPLI